MCPPLWDPTTETAPIWLAGTPRIVIWVDGAATCPPGTGNTLTGVAAWATAAGPSAAAAHTNNAEAASRRRPR